MDEILRLLFMLHGDGLSLLVFLVRGLVFRLAGYRDQPLESGTTPLDPPQNFGVPIPIGY